jgi:drug/metabolite transporter (DMT)-like permease
MKTTYVYYALIAASMITGALMPLVLATAKAVNITEFFLFTYLIGIPFSALLVFITKKQSNLALYLKEPKRLGLIVLMGLLTYLPFNVAILYAEHFVSASLATVVFRISPLLMLLFLPTLLREKLSRSQVVALLLAFIGVYIALTGGQPTSILSNPNLPIVALLVGAALSYALSTLLMKRYAFDVPSELLIFNVALFAIFGTLFLLTGAPQSQISLSNIGAMFYIAVANNIIGFYLYFTAIRILKTTFVTNLYFLSPFITFLFAHFLLGEAILPYYLVIAALVAVGLLIQKYDKLGGTYAAKKTSRRRNFTIFDVSGAFLNTGERAIVRILNDGGRVLAVRLPGEQKGAVQRLIDQNKDGYTNVFTSEHGPIGKEVSLIKEIMGAEPNDMILMKVGSFDEGELFFGDMADKLHIIPGDEFQAK